MAKKDKIITDVFDMAADAYGRILGSNSRPMPDTSKERIDHLISEEEMSDPAKLYAPTDVTPDIDFKCVARLGLLDIYDGSYPSPVQSPFKENNVVHALHYRIRGWDKGAPCVLMINGLHVDGNAYFDWWCWRFAAWGLSSVLINIPYHIKRTPKDSYSGEYLFTADTAWSLLSLKQTFLDCMQLVNWLKANGAGDVGTFGVSFGALMAGLYACNAHNAEFTIMGMPPMDAMDTLGKIGFGENLKKLEKKGRKTMMSDERVPMVFNMSRMTPNVPTKNIFIAMGVYDRLVAPESIEETARKWGGLPWLRKYQTGHINTFVFNRGFVKDVKRFIKTEIV